MKHGIKLTFAELETTFLLVFPSLTEFVEEPPHIKFIIKTQSRVSAVGSRKSASDKIQKEVKRSVLMQPWRQTTNCVEIHNYSTLLVFYD